MYAAVFMHVFLAQFAAPPAREHVEVALRDPAAEVNVFRRDATFVAKDRRVRFLNVAGAGEPKPVFRIDRIGDLNCPIALGDEPQSVIVTDGTTIYRVNNRGEATHIVALKDVDIEGQDGKVLQRARGVPGIICWLFATSTSRKLLYFVLQEPAQESLCRLNLESLSVKVVKVHFADGADVDLDTGAFYLPGSPKAKQGLMRDFEGKVERRLPNEFGCRFCKLSPDKKRLLLSNDDTVAHSRMTLVELATGNESALPVEGALANWYDDRVAYFVRGSNSLWRYELGSAEAVQVFKLGGQSDPGNGVAPQFSADKTWLAWGWSSETPAGFKHGTILYDLKANEYRQLNGWWQNVQWLSGASHPVDK